MLAKPPPPLPEPPLASPPRLLGARARPELGAISVDDEVAARLAFEPQTNTTCLELDLYGQRVGDHGARALASALERNTALTHLDLALNRIGSEGAHALLATLRKNRNIVSLDLSGNDGADAELLAAVANQLEANELPELAVPSARPDSTAQPTLGLTSHRSPPEAPPDRPAGLSELERTSLTPIETEARPSVLPAVVTEELLRRGLDAEQIEHLAAELLASQSGVKSLVLTSCQFSSAAAIALGKALWAPGLASLALVDASMTTTAFSQLAACLEKLAPLTTLRIQSPQGALFEHGAKPLAYVEHAPHTLLGHQPHDPCPHPSPSSLALIPRPHIAPSPSTSLRAPTQARA